jgi:flagellar protein FliO/FliZ
MTYKKTLVWMVLSALILINPFAVHAEQKDYYVGDCLKDPDKCNSGKDKAGDSGSGEEASFSLGVLDFAKMFGALLFVIVLLYALLKFIHKKSQTYQQNSLIQNMGGTALGGSRSIQMVRIGKRLFILGVGENIQLIKEIADEKEIQEYVRQHHEQLEKSLQPANIAAKLWRGWQDAAKQKQQIGQGDFRSHLMAEMDAIKKERKQTLGGFRRENGEHE